MWGKLPLYKYIEILNYEKTDFISITEYNTKVACIINDVPDNHYDFYTDDEFNEVIKSILFIHKQPEKPIKQIGKFKLIKYDDLLLSELVEIKHYFKTGHNYLPNILSILYRSVKSEGDDESDEELNDYKYSKKKNDFFLNQNSDLIGTLNDYLLYDKNEMDIYENIYPKPDENNPQPIIQEETRWSRWQWESFCLFIADNDYTKIEQVMAMNHLQAYNNYTMKEDFRELEKMRNKNKQI